MGAFLHVSLCSFGHSFGAGFSWSYCLINVLFIATIAVFLWLFLCMCVRGAMFVCWLHIYLFACFFFPGCGGILLTQRSYLRYNYGTLCERY